MRTSVAVATEPTKALGEEAAGSVANGSLLVVGTRAAVEAPGRKAVGSSSPGNAAAL